MQKRVLVLGATGAMGRYLVPILAEMGFRVDAVSLDEAPSIHPNVTRFKADAKDKKFLRQLLPKSYDGIVDFLIYGSRELPEYLPELLDRTEHYIYLSSYRVYDDKEHPIRENSPRLLDASDDVLLRNSDDYSIYKARGENMLRGLSKRNWTIVRPAITYSLMRYPLVTLEAHDTLGRAFAGKRTVLPREAENVRTTLSWGGDVARMLAGLLFNEKALCEDFTVSTAEHRTWGEIAGYYRELCKLEAVWVDKEDYLRLVQPDPYCRGARWQLEYDRLFDRTIDNTKVLAATSMTQSSLVPIFEGLHREIARCPKDFEWKNNDRMDDYLAGLK